MDHERERLMSFTNAPIRRRNEVSLGVFAVAVILAGCGSTSTNTTSPPPANTSPTTTQKPEASSCKQPCADASGWIVEVTNVKYDVPSGNQFIKPESGNVFVTVDVKFINKTKRSHSASTFDFKLKSAGVERHTEAIGPCEYWSSVNVSAGASYGPKCVSFQAAAGKRAGNVLVWTPGLIKTYNISVH